MKNIKYALLSLLFFSATSAYAEWTGDKAEGMISNTIITNIHTGQIDNHPYFCIETQKTGNSTVACAVKDQSKWAPSFATMYDMALYFYSTGQQIRLYYEPNVWTNKYFSTITKNALVGLSNCSTISSCFGPDRKK